jgi:hypothetical protein
VLDRFYSELPKCLFDLYKVKQQKEQKYAAAVEQASQNKSAIDEQNRLVREQLEEQRNQRQLEGALEMMRRGFEMMRPPKLKLSCTYNSLMKITVCN